MHRRRQACVGDLDAPVTHCKDTGEEVDEEVAAVTSHGCLVAYHIYTPGYLKTENTENTFFERFEHYLLKRGSVKKPVGFCR